MTYEAILAGIINSGGALEVGGENASILCDYDALRGPALIVLLRERRLFRLADIVFDCDLIMARTDVSPVSIVLKLGLLLLSM